MKKRFLPLSMLLITIVLAQASFVANATDIPGKYNPRNTESEATFSSYMKSIRANQETGLIDPALMIAALKADQTAQRGGDYVWDYAGPDNFGGMTRAIIYNADGTVLIGTMGGGIYKTTNGGVTFGRVYDVNYPISCMVKDSNGVIFIGTGDGRGASLLNGLDDQGDETSFIGRGIYKISSYGLEHIAATEPTETNGWGFVNELAVTNNKIYAATDGGLWVSEDGNGESWSQVTLPEALNGGLRSVKTNNAGHVLVADGKNVFYSEDGNSFRKITVANNSNPKIIAMSPDDPNYMYIALLKGNAGSYTTGDIFFTNNGGETWGLAVATTGLYSIFGSDAPYDAFMIVFPHNPRKLFIGSNNLWVMEDKMNLGINSYKPLQISTCEASDNALTAYVAYNRYNYLHQGIQNVVFEPNMYTNPNFNTNSYKFYVGTTGGIFKGEYYDAVYSYKGGNRYYYVDELGNDKHSSVARMMAVGVGGTDKILGASLDHGTMNIYRNPLLNNETTGIAIFPNTNSQTNAYQQLIGYFTKSYAGGPCAISTIDPNILFVSGTGSLSTPIHRSESDGEDYDLTNFYGASSPVVTNSGVFKTPYAIYENYHETTAFTDLYSIRQQIDSVGYYDTIILKPIDTTLYVLDTFFVADSMIVYTDTLHVIDTLEIPMTITIYDTTYVQDTTRVRRDTLYMAIRDTMLPGEKGMYHSRIAGFPIDYVLPQLPDSLQDEHHLVNGQYVWMPKDTIWNLQDSISTIYVCGVNKKVFFTRDSHVFNKQTTWMTLSAITGASSAVAISPDGETALVGTLGGRLYKFSKLNQLFEKKQVTASDTLNYIYYNDNNFLIGQYNHAITCIYYDPTDKNHVIMSLGNYGNQDYIFRSTDGGLTFNSIQGNLPHFPIYSCLIEKRSKDILVGTDKGIYVSTDNGATWNKSGTNTSPVMEIKQATQPNRPDKEEVLYDETGQVSQVNKYPGIHNDGMIFAATYGSGILVCGSAAVVTATASEEPEEEVMTEANTEQLMVYPNPVRGTARIDIELDEDASVSYVIYDLAGHMVANRVLGRYAKGIHTLSIGTEDFAKGTYLIRVQAGNKTDTGKFLVY